jgi:hypothetical protein
MAYTFRTVNIFAFDLHTTVAPLLNETLFAEDLRFLFTPEKYHQHYHDEQVVTTASFSISPLEVKELHHYFWYSYSSIFRLGGAPDFWRLQIPFVCEVKKSPLELDLADPKVTATIVAKIFLSAIGWSTNLEIRLTGEMSSESLVGIVSRLFQQKEKPYKVDGVPHTITEVFGHFASRLRAELYTQQKPPLDKTTVDKYFVLSPELFSGKIQYYCPPNKPDHPAPSWVGGLSGEEKLSQSDHALMLSFLYGQAISISEWYDWSYERFLHTKMKGPSFALTDYDWGTFIFMQENASEAGAAKKRDALWCFASNVRYCAMMTAFLLRFHEVSKRAATESVVASLRAAIKIILNDMPIDYPNAVCTNMHRFNRGIKDVLSSTT